MFALADGTPVETYTPVNRGMKIVGPNLVFAHNPASAKKDRDSCVRPGRRHNFQSSILNFYFLL